MSKTGSQWGALKWLWLAVIVIAVDQITKAMAVHFLVLHQSVAVMPIFNFTLAHNTGAAFSFLSDQSGWQRWFFSAIALVVSMAIVAWLKRLPADAKWLPVALSLIVGGALGNVWDRLLMGYVVDFLDFHVGEWHFAAFNVADSAISVGATMLVIDALFLEAARSKARA